MSEVTNVESTSNQQITNYNTAKLFLGKNDYETGFHNNSGYEDVVLVIGTLMGRVATTGELVPLFSDATDGSQYPVGILSHDITIEPGITADLTICIRGDVDGDLVVLDPGDTMETVISDRRIKDRIASDTAGIVMRFGTEMTGTDNQ